jgi:mRNA interferase RelE/StbE
MKPISYQPAAVRALRRIPQPQARRIVEKIEQYATEPQALSGNIKTLSGRDGIRLRVGDYRVIMLDAVVLDILDIGHRKDIYR